MLGFWVSGLTFNADPENTVRVRIAVVKHARAYSDNALGTACASSCRFHMLSDTCACHVD